MTKTSSLSSIQKLPSALFINTATFLSLQEKCFLLIHLSHSLSLMLVPQCYRDDSIEFTIHPPSNDFCQLKYFSHVRELNLSSYQYRETDNDNRGIKIQQSLIAAINNSSLQSLSIKDLWNYPVFRNPLTIKLFLNLLSNRNNLFSSSQIRSLTFENDGMPDDNSSSWIALTNCPSLTSLTLTRTIADFKSESLKLFLSSLTPTSRNDKFRDKSFLW